MDVGSGSGVGADAGVGAGRGVTVGSGAGLGAAHPTSIADSSVKVIAVVNSPDCLITHLFVACIRNFSHVGA